TILSAVDPANPFGALIPWPATGAGEDAKPRRVSGAVVVIVNGKPVLYLPSGGRHLLTFPSMYDEGRDELVVAARALNTLTRPGRKRRIVVEKVDNVAVRESPHHDLLVAAGYVSDYRGLVPTQAFN
ncbi:MAG: hypothetical protein KJO55_10240, partial [Gammaproteobacteria bacterium]|nr:hypothetical protein [Gammaproteobacteria bacterium]